MRYYAAWIGRWTAVDPKQHEYLSQSPYNYVENNPIILIDPNGEYPIVYRYQNADGSIHYGYYATPAYEEFMFSFLGLVPFAGLSPQIADWVNSDSKIIGGNDIKNVIKSSAQTGLDVVDIVNYISDLGKFGKWAGAIGTALSVYDIISNSPFFWDQSYVEQALDQLMLFYMNSSTEEGVILKYAVGLEMVSTLIENGKLTFDVDGWGAVSNVHTTDLEYYQEIESTFMRIDAQRVIDGHESIDFYYDLYKFDKNEAQTMLIDLGYDE